MLSVVSIGEEENAISNTFPIEFSKSEYRLFPKFIAFFYILCLPAIFLENLNLFFLCTLPAIGYISKKIKYLSQPKEFRQAVNTYLKENPEETLIPDIISG